MKMNTFNELKKASNKKASFLVMINEENKVVSELDNLGFKDTTLINYLTELENSYNAKIEGLEAKIDKQDKIIQELISAIKTLNKGV